LKKIIAYEVDGKIVDTQSFTNEKDATPIYFDNSDKALQVIRHSAAHLMAQAIKELYPKAQFFVGPVVEEGFTMTSESIRLSVIKSLKRLKSG